MRKEESMWAPKMKNPCCFLPADHAPATANMTPGVRKIAQSTYWQIMTTSEIYESGAA